MAATLISDMLTPQDEDAGPGPSAEGKSAEAIADTNGVPVSAGIDDKDMQKSTAGFLLGEHCFLAMDVSCLLHPAGCNARQSTCRAEFPGHAAFGSEPLCVVSSSCTVAMYGCCADETPGADAEAPAAQTA